MPPDLPTASDPLPPSDGGPPLATPSHRTDRAPTWAQAIAVVIMVAVVATLAGFLLGRTTSAPPRATDADDRTTVATLPAAAIPRSALGEADAPVTLIVYSDFQCPYCARHASETHPALVERYVDEGLVRIEWRDFPALGSGSLQLAVAGRAAEQQGRFWAFHDTVYASTGPATDLAGVRALAQEAGLDMEAFDAAMADPLLELAVRRDLDEARTAGFTGTPAFTIDGRAIMGAQPLDTFVQVIEQQLAGDAPAAPVRLAPEDAEALLADPPDGLQVVDVRTPEEVAEGTLVPRDGLLELDFYDETHAQDLLATLDPDRPVLVYCRSGNRSSQTTQFLADQGFDEVYDLDGGVVGWQGSGRDLVR